MACRRVASRPRAAPKCPSPPSLWPSVLCALALAATASQRCRSPATHASPVRASQLFGRPSPENTSAAASADTFFCFKASSSTTSRRPRARRRRGSSCSRRSAGDARDIMVAKRGGVAVLLPIERDRTGRRSPTCEAAAVAVAVAITRRHGALHSRARGGEHKCRCDVGAVVRVSRLTAAAVV